MVTSTFLNSYPGVENKSIQRLIRTEKHPTEENMIILHDWLFSGSASTRAIRSNRW